MLTVVCARVGDDRKRGSGGGERHRVQRGQSGDPGASRADVRVHARHRHEHCRDDRAVGHRRPHGRPTEDSAVVTLTALSRQLSSS